MDNGYSRNQSSPGDVGSGGSTVRFDSKYIRTLPGVLKLVEMLANLIGFICIKVALNAWISGIFYNILYWFGIIITGMLLVFYMFHLVEKFDKIPWLKFEFFYCAAMTIAYIVISIIATTLNESGGYAVGFFGLCAIIAYGTDGYLKYKDWRRGLPAQ